MDRQGRERTPPWVGIAVALAVMTMAGAAGAETLKGPALTQALQKGGYVLVLRHASSPLAAPDAATANPDNVNHERQLDETGRKTAAAMGAAIKKLRIPLGDLESSPAYRALETVRYAGFGKPTPVPDLGDGGQGMMADAAGQRSTWLRARVTKPPRAGANTLLVTHLPNMKGAFDKDAADLADGETMVFLPGKDGAATMAGRVKIEEWPTLSAPR